jgi:hypothetical protein
MMRISLPVRDRTRGDPLYFCDYYVTCEALTPLPAIVSSFVVTAFPSVLSRAVNFAFLVVDSFRSRGDGTFANNIK